MSLVIDGLTEKEGLKVYSTLRKQFGADDPVTLYAEKHFVAPFLKPITIQEAVRKVAKSPLSDRKPLFKFKLEVSK